MKEAPGPINFTMFLTMFGEKLNGTDPEDVIRNAFACFDENNSGKMISYYFYLLVFSEIKIANFFQENLMKNIYASFLQQWATGLTMNRSMICSEKLQLTQQEISTTAR